LIKLRRILIVTPFLTQTSPPMFRIRSFINELKKKNQLHVINTSCNGNKDNVSYYKIKDNFSSELDKKTKIREHPVFRSFILPFFYIGWIVSCFIKGSKLIEKNKIDIIFVSHGPPHVLIVGYLLKLRQKNCIFITDYRDSWTDNPYRTYPTRIIRRVLHNIEKDVLDKSNLIIVVSEVEKKRFLLNYENIYDKIAIIRNGFFNIGQDEKNQRKYFKITHSGNFYKKKQPDLIFKAYKRFLDKINRKDSKFFFIGKLSDKNIDKIRIHGLQDDTILVGNISYKKALSQIQDSDLLLFYEPTLAMTTKIYDYISSGNPILVVTENTEVIKFVNKYSPYSIIITEYNEELMAKSMFEFYNNWEKGIEYDFKLKSLYYKKYSRNNLAKTLVAKIHET